MQELKQWLTKQGYLAVVKLQYCDGKPSHYCGYVGVPRSHPIVNDNCPHCGHDMETRYNLDVHGGITYSAFSDNYPIKNIDIYWLGFDCHHSCDISLLDIAKNRHLHRPEATFKDMSYCEAQCEKLSQQLYELLKK